MRTNGCLGLLFIKVPQVTELHVHPNNGPNKCTYNVSLILLEDELHLAIYHHRAQREAL